MVPQWPLVTKPVKILFVPALLFIERVNTGRSTRYNSWDVFQMIAAKPLCDEMNRDSSHVPQSIRFLLVVYWFIVFELEMFWSRYRCTVGSDNNYSDNNIDNNDIDDNDDNDKTYDNDNLNDGIDITTIMTITVTPMKIAITKLIKCYLRTHGRQGTCIGIFMKMAAIYKHASKYAMKWMGGHYNYT